MHPLIAKLLPGPVITDGAWGTQLQAQGLGAGECPDLWNLTHPDRVEKVARSYVDAGSQVILTNTFGATRMRLADHNAGDKTAAINKAGVEISKRAAAGRALVFASVGPTGKMLAMGEATEEELRATFAEQINALAAAGADAILLETFADLDETRAAIAAAKASGLPVIASLVFDSGAQRDRTMMGATPEEAVAALTEAGVDAVGANCGRGIEGYLSIAKRLRAATTLPVWIKANAGLPEIVAGQTVYPAIPEFFADKAAEVVATGTNFIGGCCGTSPAFIAAIAKKFRRA
ncbi:MAG: homocysteine S-methyltransferase family protein [Nibricoccus sp.]